jgi:protein-S-isoprenylcysteine O-methyltransferase Ste14
MIEPLAVSALPALFLAVFYGGEALMWRRKIDSAGRPAVGKGLLSASKYAIIVPWGAMVLRSWGLGIDLIGRPIFLKWIALILWGLGFALLLLGRFSLGTAFRVGLAREKTRLEQNGIYRYSRNPMYLGIYLTLLSASFIH